MPDSNPLPRRSRKPGNPAGSNPHNSTLLRPQMLSQTDQQRDAPSDISSEEIARRAYSRWEDSDRSHGRDQEHWFAAEEDLRRDRTRRRRNGEDADTSEMDEVG